MDKVWELSQTIEQLRDEIEKALRLIGAQRSMLAAASATIQTQAERLAELEEQLAATKETIQ